jgi:hypothetical protein
MPLELRDRLHQPIYDTVALKFAGQRNNLFTSALGTGVGLFGGAKTWVETNMYLSGQLPAGWIFNATGIECELFPLESYAGWLKDRERIIQSGHIELLIGAKSFTTVPLSQTTQRRARQAPAVRFDAELKDGVLVGAREATALLDKLSGWSPDDFNRAATTLADLLLGPPGFMFEIDGRVVPLAIPAVHNFMVQARVFQPLATNTTIALRCLLHGHLGRPVA